MLYLLEVVFFISRGGDLEQNGHVQLRACAFQKSSFYESRVRAILRKWRLSMRKSEFDFIVFYQFDFWKQIVNMSENLEDNEIFSSESGKTRHFVAAWEFAAQLAAQLGRVISVGRVQATSLLGWIDPVSAASDQSRALKDGIVYGREAATCRGMKRNILDTRSTAQTQSKRLSCFRPAPLFFKLLYLLGSKD